MATRLTIMQCPFCGSRTAVEYFPEHCWKNHPEVEMPDGVTAEYLHRRFAPLGGVVFEGVTNNPSLLLESEL